MNDPIENETTSATLLQQVTEIVSAYVKNNSISTSDLPALIASTHIAFKALSSTQADLPVETLTAAVPIKKSITPDFIICLDDGKKFKSMKRHLAGLGMTPEEYRSKWGLPTDYPMVAPNYSATRSSMAKSNGLGRKPALKPPVPTKPTRKFRANA